MLFFLPLPDFLGPKVLVQADNVSSIDGQDLEARPVGIAIGAGTFELDRRTSANRVNGTGYPGR